jgi:hypothetical protein
VIAAVTVAAPDRATILCFACATDHTSTIYVPCEGCSRAVPATFAEPVCRDWRGSHPERT